MARQREGRPGTDTPRAPLYVGEVARSMLSAGPVTPDDVTVVQRLPRGAHEPDVHERQALAVAFGAHVLDLIDSGRLAVRIGGDRAMYWRPAGWRSLTIDEQTRLVVDMLNGSPRAVA